MFSPIFTHKIQHTAESTKGAEIKSRKFRGWEAMRLSFSTS